MQDQERWRKIKEIVADALEREPRQRTEFVNAACGPDESLRAEVESLLSAHGKASDLSESASPTEPGEMPEVTKTLGPYRLLQKLGEGGMGQVWLAEQTIPVRRRVALKLIRAGMYDESALRRFQSERQSLAIMDHPSIAKVFEAGATADGQPYFAMEYVPGTAITDYCDQKKLKIRERLELFIRTCEGVQHAHQKAVIHRDLKPANILVVEVDGKAVPRIIDFGLAKPVSPLLTGDTSNTQIGSFLGTPGYMSPEQADPGAVDIDTRADVYSLGVILYELLTGFLPLDIAEWKKLPLHSLLQHLREDDPQKPSTKVSASRETSASKARARGFEPAQLASALRGDLDWIVMKALEKDRNRRYGSPTEFAADLRHYLKNEPIVARPASAAYRLRKYVSRHRAGVAAGAGIFVLLTGFGILQTIQIRRITRERDRANRITGFMTGMFQVSNPSEARGNSVTAREILDKAAQDVDTGLAKDPEMQAQMMDVMGAVFDNLGLYAQAEKLAQQSVQTYSKTLGPNDPLTLSAESNLGNIVYDEGKFPESEKLYRHSYEELRRQLGPKNLKTLQAMDNLANAVFEEGRYGESEKLYREALDMARASLGPDHRQTVIQMGNLVNNLTAEGRNADAEALAREVLEARRRSLGADHPETIRSISDLGDIQVQEGKYREAEALFGKH